MCFQGILGCVCKNAVKYLSSNLNLRNVPRRMPLQVFLMLLVSELCGVDKSLTQV